MMYEITGILINWNIWLWLSIGILLIILELYVPGVFMVWFGLGAILTGLLVSLLSLYAPFTQILLFILMSVLSTVFGFFVYKKVFGKNKEIQKNHEVGASRYIGKRFIVAETIKNGKGKVAVGDSVWIALSDKTIQKGEEVVVKDTKGTQLIVD